MKLSKNEGEFTPAEFLVNRKTKPCKYLKSSQLVEFAQLYAAKVVHRVSFLKACYRIDYAAMR